MYKIFPQLCYQLGYAYIAERPQEKRVSLIVHSINTRVKKKG